VIRQSSLIAYFFFVALFTAGQKDLDQLEEKAYSAYSASDSKAIDHAYAFLDAARKPNSVYTINAHTLLGILYKDKGMYVTSLEHYLFAAEIARKQKDMPRTSVCLNNIGSIHQLQGNYEKAKSYFLESLRIENSLNVPEQKSIRYYNLAEIYREQDSTDLALSNYNNSLQIEESFKNPDGIAYALVGIADVYIKLKRTTDAEITLERVEKMLPDLSADLIILFHLNSGKLMVEKDLHSQALEHLDKALSEGDRVQIYIHHLKILEQKIAVLKMLKNFPELIQTYDRYLSILKQQNSAAIKNQLNDLSYQNNLKQKELEIKLLSEERDIAKKNSESIVQINRLTRNIIIFLVITIAGITIAIFYLYKQLFKK
jgi:tetratricopeptide (TPR) repeat protein